ncbi:Origin recognition complex subunit 5 [Entomortierella lignicola]|nr:Origin recognition complex subunit 5 [Entomortierella lignicola]
MAALSPQKQLHDAFPGRTKQIDQILAFMGTAWAPTPPALFINGSSSLGKTVVVKTILSTLLEEKSPSRYAFLDCVECHTPRLIFEHAIYQFRNAPQQKPLSDRLAQIADQINEGSSNNKEHSSTPSIETMSTTGRTKSATATGGESQKRKRHIAQDDVPWEKCENINEFVEWCRKICDKDGSDESISDKRRVPSRSNQHDTRYLVLDRAERLRDTAPTLIPVLMRLQELTGRNICVILITTIVWEKFRSKTGGYEPIILNFPQYSKDISFTIAILERDIPDGQDKELYTRFVDLVYDVFQRNCKDLNEIRHLVALLFPLYIKPVKEGKIQKHEGLKLHRHIQAYFVEAMDKLYLREISSMEWSDRTILASSSRNQDTKHDRPSGYGGATTDSGSFSSATSSERALMNAVEIQNTFDLPYYTKFILIASFLASYNPPKLDMRYFAKVSNQGGKMSRRAKVSAAKKHGHEQQGSKLRQQLLGPKPFPIERMLAIFYSILDDEVEENVNVHTQIASLVSLRLLQRVTPMDRLDSIKCKCNVSYDMIKALAKSTKFEIDKYLYDFT